VLGLAHERFASAEATDAAVHEEFRDVGAVRLVLGLREHELHGAYDAGAVLGDEKGAGAVGDLASDVAPESRCLLERQREHEAHRCAAFNAVDQDERELVDLGIGDRQYATDRDHCATTTA